MPIVFEIYFELEIKLFETSQVKGEDFDF